MGWIKKGSVGFIFLVILGSVIALWFLKVPIMSAYLSNRLGIPVSMLGIKIRPSYTTITRFRIANPRSAKTKTAFASKKIRADYSVQELFGTPTTVDQISLNNVFLSIEFYNPLGTVNNWTEIAKNMPKKEGKKKGKGYLIRKLVINDLLVEIHGMGLGGLLGKVETKRIPRLEFTNISSEEGFPTEQLIRAIFGRTGLDQYIKDLFSPGRIIPDAAKPLFRLFGKKEEALPDVECLPEN